MSGLKQLIRSLVVVAGLVAAGSPAFAGRDQSQIIQQERTLAAAKQAQMQSGNGAAAAKRGGEPGTDLPLLKRFHPKNAYGY